MDKSLLDGVINYLFQSLDLFISSIGITGFLCGKK
jgi:hypothetical protein